MERFDNFVHKYGRGNALKLPWESKVSGDPDDVDKYLDMVEVFTSMGKLEIEEKVQQINTKSMFYSLNLILFYTYDHYIVY